MNTSTSTDLSNCDKEPVAFIGSVQSFGALLAINKHSNIVTHVSANIEEFLGQNAESLVGKDFKDSFSFVDKSKFHVQTIECENVKIYEIEKPRTSESCTLRKLLDYLEQLRSTKDLSALVVKATELVSQITGQDRVMIYKFHEDLHGEVIAESLKEGADSFLGLHYPATDIPKPARDLFYVNWVRMIEDVSARTYPVISLDDTEIDLTRSLVRAVSPIHIDYLRNMGVESTLTISLKVEDKLWGLIATQHKCPRYFSPGEREICEVIGRTMSLLIQDFERREREDHLKKLSIVKEALIANVHDIERMGAELTKNSPNLLDLFNSEGTGAAISINGSWVTTGTVPDEEQLNDLASWLHDEHSDKILFQTNELSISYAKAATFSKIGSGLLAVCIPKTARSYILWFRPEYIETVKWAGNPNDKVIKDGRLTPRKSFDDWAETVRGKSRPWKSWECEAAIDLRNSVIALDLKHQYKKEQLARAEAERAVKAREELISVVSHDLKNPLNSILISTQLIERQLSAEAVKVRSLSERIRISATMMNNLIDDILNITKLEAGGGSLELITKDITDVLNDAVEILGPLASQKSIIIQQHFDYNVVMKFDHGRILQVLSNILGNAIKFTPIKGRIDIKTVQHEDGVLISISDTGPGIPSENLPHVFDRFWQAKQTSRLGTGLGLAIAKEIISSHGGRIWAESKLGEYSTFFFTIPTQL